jgi:hypothetical protein
MGIFSANQQEFVAEPLRGGEVSALQNVVLFARLGAPVDDGRSGWHRLPLAKLLWVAHMARE